MNTYNGIEPMKSNTPNQPIAILQSQLGLTNQQLADALDVSRSAIQKYRAGALPVPRSVIMAMRFMLATCRR